jgi:spermidine/putrescine transport system substrate-binding protein
MKIEFKIVATCLISILIGVAIGYYFAPSKIMEAKQKLPFEGQELIVGIWSGPYEKLFTDAFITPFEQETGAKIQVIPHWGYIPQLLASPPGQPPLDITMVTLDEAIRGIAHQLWLPLRYENIPNAKDIWPFLWNLTGDDVKPYAVPFDVGAMVLMFRKDLIDFQLTSWDDLWNPKLKGLISLEDCDWPQPAIYIGALLCKAKPGVQEIYTSDGLDLVYQTLASMSRNLKFWFKSGADFVTALKAGEVVVGSYWHGSALAVASEDSRIGVVLPNETAAYFDLFCITNGTKKRDLAEAFLNYILSPEAQSRFISTHGNFMSNKKVSLPLYKLDILNMYPKTEDDWSRIHFFDDRYIVPLYDQLYERLQQEVFPLAGG